MARRKAAPSETPQAPVVEPVSAATAPFGPPPQDPVAEPVSAVTAPPVTPPAPISPEPRIERFGSITRINH